MFKKIRPVFAVLALTMTVLGLGAGAQASPVPTNAGVTASIGHVNIAQATGKWVNRTTTITAPTRVRCLELRQTVIEGVWDSSIKKSPNWTDCKNAKPWPWQSDEWKSTVSYLYWVK